MTARMRQAPLDADVLDDAAQMIRVLGHPVRLRIVEALEDGERTVTYLQEHLGAPQAIVSQQLARMKAGRLLRCRRDGTSVWYAVADPRVLRVLACLRTCDLPAKRGH